MNIEKSKPEFFFRALEPIGASFRQLLKLGCLFILPVSGGPNEPD